MYLTYNIEILHTFKIFKSYKTISCHLKFLRLRDFEIPINEWDLPFSFKYNQSKFLPCIV